jgi:hypothetical protein
VIKIRTNKRIDHVIKDGKGRILEDSKQKRADLRTLRQPGTYPGTEDSCALRLARAIHGAESTCCVTSWSAQEQAQDFYNAHGLAASLDECSRLEALRLPNADN